MKMSIFFLLKNERKIQKSLIMFSKNIFHIDSAEIFIKLVDKTHVKKENILAVN
jgi:hypothetical protein